MQSNSTNETNHSAIIDSLIIKCNSAVKQAMTGNMIAWCGLMVDIARGLEILRSKVGGEIDQQNKKIEMLKQQIKELEKDGAENGTD